MTPVIAASGVALNLLLASACYFVVIRRSGRDWLIFMGLGHLMASLFYATGPIPHFHIHSDANAYELHVNFFALVGLCGLASARVLFLFGALRLYGASVSLRGAGWTLAAITTTVTVTHIIFGAQIGNLGACLISEVCFVFAGARMLGAPGTFHRLTGVSLLLRAILTGVLVYESYHPFEIQTLDSLMVLTFVCISMTGFGVLLIEFDDMRRRLLEADNAKAMFLASLSHELRTPLNAVIGFSEIIGGSGIHCSADDYRRYASHILEAGRALLRLVDQVLHFTALSTGEASLSTKPVSLDRVIDEAVSPLRGDAAQKEIELQLRFSRPEIWVHSDFLAVRHIVTSLVRRAIDVSERGGAVAVNVKLDERSRIVSIEVQDWDRIREAGSSRKIFAPYGQVENAYKSNSQGLGLELAIAYRLIKLIGGKVRVSSKGGAGTRILFSIPANVGSGVADEYLAKAS